MLLNSSRQHIAHHIEGNIVNKQTFLLTMIILCHAVSIQGQHSENFAIADKHFDAKSYIQAISEYSSFLNISNTDYALYKIGLCKKEIATFCVSEEQFAKYPDMYRRKYGKRYSTYKDYINFIKERKDQFWYFEPAAVHVYKGADFNTIISEYPNSEYIDDCAYELLLESRHLDWEGDYRDMLPRIDRCKGFLKSYPDSDLRDKVINLCLEDYGNVIHSGNLPESLKAKYQKEMDAFNKYWE